MHPTLIEVAVENPMEVRAAQGSGATQVVIVRQIMEGGNSPDTKTIEACMDAAKVPVSVLVKPDTGDFVYEEARRTRTLKILEFYWKRGIRNITFGGVHDGVFDWDLLEDAISCGFTVNINQAFDFTRNPQITYLKLVQYPQVLQIVTSGKCQVTAPPTATLEQLVANSTPQLPVLLDFSAGTRPEELPSVLASGVHGVHLGTGVRDAQGRMNFTLVERIGMVCKTPGRKHQRTF